MFVLLAYFVFAIMVGMAATARGRSGLGWFLLSLFISPLLTILFLLALPNKHTQSLLTDIRREVVDRSYVDDAELERNIEKSRSLVDAA
jgi:hypothetical protein